jgi:predicted nucleic acid-binding protein
MPPRSILAVYWDACAWIGFINREAKKIHPLAAIWDDAKNLKVEIWTSSYSYLEVIKGALGHGELHHGEEMDPTVDNILAQPFVKVVNLDSEIAKLARKIRRDLYGKGQDNGPIPRPDSIHLATASFCNCAELHTWDTSHMLDYKGLVVRADGRPLAIRIPGPEVDGPLFTPPDDGDAETKNEN